MRCLLVCYCVLLHAARPLTGTRDGLVLLCGVLVLWQHGGHLQASLQM